MKTDNQAIDVNKAVEAARELTAAFLEMNKHFLELSETLPTDRLKDVPRPVPISLLWAYAVQTELTESDFIPSHELKIREKEKPVTGIHRYGNWLGGACNDFGITRLHDMWTDDITREEWELIRGKNNGDVVIYQGKRVMIAGCCTLIYSKLRNSSYEEARNDAGSTAFYDASEIDFDR